MRFLTSYFTILFALLVLSGCGGGGGGGDSSSGVSISLDKTSLTFTAQQGGAVPASRTVVATYNGDAIAVGYPTYADEVSWLDITQIGTEQDNPLSVQFSILSTNLAPGTYTTTVRFGVVDTEGRIAYKDLSVKYVVEDGLAVNTLAMSFEGAVGAAELPGQSFSVLGDGYSWKASTNVNWLTLDQTSGTGSATVTATAKPGALGIGEYQGTISVLDTASGDVRKIAVTMTLRAPTLTVDAADVNFYGTNGKAIATKTLNVSLDNGAVTTWNAATTAKWLTLNGASDSASGTTPGQLVLGIDAQAANLATGEYSTTLTLSANVGTLTLTRDIAVTLKLVQMTFTTIPSSLKFQGINGSDLGSQIASFALDVDQYHFPWTATSSANWLKLGGQATASGTDSGDLSVSIDASALASGTYAGEFTIEAQVNGDTLTKSVAVDLDLTKATLSFDTDAITFGGVNGTDLGVETVNVTLNTGAVSHPWSGVITTDDGGSWLLSDAQLAGDVSASASAVSVHTDVTGMLGAVYGGQLQVTAQVNGDTVTGTLPVELQLQPHRLFAPDNGVALASFPTATSTLTADIELTDNGGLPVDWSASDDADWLTVTASGTTDSVLTLSADVTGLAEGIHLANVTVTSQDATIENDELITVGLFVSPSDPVASPSQVTLHTNSKLSAIVTDPVRPYVYVSYGDGSIDVFNVYSSALEFTIDAGTGLDLRQMAVSSDGSRLYAVNHDDDGDEIDEWGIVTVDLTTNPVTTQFRSANLPPCYSCSAPQYYLMDIVYTRPNGYPVLLTGGLEVIDAADGTVVGTFERNRFYYRTSVKLAVDPSGTAVFAQSLGNSGHDLGRFDLSYSYLFDSAKAVESATKSETGFASDIAVSLDGTKVYTACGSPYEFRSYDASTLSVLTPLAGDAYPTAIEVAPNGDVYGGIYNFYATEEIFAYDASGAALGTYSVYGELDNRGLVISGDSRRMVTRSNDSVTLSFYDAP